MSAAPCAGGRKLRHAPHGGQHQDRRREHVRHDHADLPFEERGEHVGGHQAHGHAAQGPAGRDQQVELRQVPRVGPQPHQFAVADHADEEHRREIQDQSCGVVHRHADVQQIAGDPVEHRVAPVTADDRQHRQAAQNRPHVPPRVIEADDEREQVQRQRHDPQERHHGHVLADVVRGGQEHQRAQAGSSSQSSRGASAARPPVIAAGRRAAARRLAAAGIPRPRSSATCHAAHAPHSRRIHARRPPTRAATASSGRRPARRRTDSSARPPASRSSTTRKAGRASGPG